MGSSRRADPAEAGGDLERSTPPAGHEHQVAHIDHHPHPLADDEDRIAPAMNRVDEQADSAQDAQPPERDRDHRVALLLGGSPLHEEPGREDPLAQEPEGLPANRVRHRGPSDPTGFPAQRGLDPKLFRHVHCLDSGPVAGAARPPPAGPRRPGSSGCRDGNATSQDPGSVTHRYLHDSTPLADEQTGRRSGEPHERPAGAAPLPSGRSAPSNRCLGSIDRERSCAHRLARRLITRFDRPSSPGRPPAQGRVEAGQGVPELRQCLRRVLQVRVEQADPPPSGNPESRDRSPPTGRRSRRSEIGRTSG